MCKPFSCIVGMDKKVTWKFGVDSHTELIRLTSYRDDTGDKKEMTFARVEITPENGSYLNPDQWELKVDERVKPVWWGRDYEQAAWGEHEKWLKEWLKELNKILVRKRIVNPFRVEPLAEITERHIELLREWDEVWDEVWGAVRDEVWDEVWGAVWDEVWDEVWGALYAYIGSFLSLPQWKDKYPFASAVELWEMGLVPSFDGAKWRLHAGAEAKIVYEIGADELRSGAGAKC